MDMFSKMKFQSQDVKGLNQNQFRNACSRWSRANLTVVQYKVERIQSRALCKVEHEIIWHGFNSYIHTMYFCCMQSRTLFKVEH